VNWHNLFSLDFILPLVVSDSVTSSLFFLPEVLSAVPQRPRPTVDSIRTDFFLSPLVLILFSFSHSPLIFSGVSLPPNFAMSTLLGVSQSHLLLPAEHSTDNQLRLSPPVRNLTIVPFAGATFASSITNGYARSFVCLFIHFWRGAVLRFFPSNFPDDGPFPLVDEFPPPRFFFEILVSYDSPVLPLTVCSSPRRKRVFRPSRMSVPWFRISQEILNYLPFAPYEPVLFFPVLKFLDSFSSFPTLPGFLDARKETFPFFSLTARSV